MGIKSRYEKKYGTVRRIFRNATHRNFGSDIKVRPEDSYGLDEYSHASNQDVPRYVPTPYEIAQATARIREDWTEAEHRVRAGMGRWEMEDYQVPEVIMPANFYNGPMNAEY